ncbi:MAG: hypothetical protein A2622_07850 [Bdellovibrionales bacterium RIFCSPHIGHO2_01_FULL_40_29]|nr:MAG: hypothetical protein A2622_07850 [Bdellovibrionales bacterium RIFCSPHIGHO2_01_FULL_40_29]OFZ33719.1 MAG: hypothetical protein A3D17_09940 [Bdellovibrionales bacterium RIFCSPHIGHO2_02_FULL_40_15]
MKKIILTLATLLLTVTASAGTSDIGSADQNSKKYEYPYVYDCKQSIGNKNRVITVLSKTEVAITSGDRVATWSANYEGQETMDFQYLNHDVYMKISKSMMKEGAKSGQFSADNALEVFNCKLRK